MSISLVSSASNALPVVVTPASTSRERTVDPLSLERKVQNVFSAVLANFGREGFKSAEPIDDAVQLETAARQSWEQWFQESVATRYTFRAGSDSPSVRENKSPSDLQNDFSSLLSDAYRKGGYMNPIGYLTQLNPEALAALQQVHHLADPIEVGALSPEGALNLLLPPSAQVDEDRDGLTEVGIGRTIRFPDSNTPADVRNAWEAATAEMSESDRMMYVLQVKIPLLTANMHFDSEGAFLGYSQPGGDDWINPQISTDFSYLKMADEWLNYLDLFANQLAPEQYERDTKFWKAFREELERPSA